MLCPLSPRRIILSGPSRLQDEVEIHSVQDLGLLKGLAVLQPRVHEDEALLAGRDAEVLGDERLHLPHRVRRLHAQQLDRAVRHLEAEDLQHAQVQHSSFLEVAVEDGRVVLQHLPAEAQALAARVTVLLLEHPSHVLDGVREIHVQLDGGMLECDHGEDESAHAVVDLVHVDARAVTVDVEAGALEGRLEALHRNGVARCGVEQQGRGKVDSVGALIEC